MKQPDKQKWDKFWKKYRFSLETDKHIIDQELNSVRWKKIQKRISDKYGDFKNLRVIEIGSGRGEIAVIMALRGADVTLVDYSEIALERAKILFDHLGARANFLHQDILNMPENSFGSFDISMSFGLVEHFVYPQRLQILKLHSDLIRNNGISFVAAPNAYCWPYRLFMAVSSLLGYSFEDQEIPFTPNEFKKNALPAGFKKYEIVGSSFIRDSAYFLFTRYVSHLAKWKFILDTSILEIPTFFDDYFGYSLVFIGSKI